MKYQIMIRMLMMLLSRKRVTAAEIAERYEISMRSVYRYVEELNVAGIPIDVVRGRYGGIYVADTFRLPTSFFTKGEYEAAINALTAMSTQMNDEDTLSALEKLKYRSKQDMRETSVCGNIIVDGGAWCDMGTFSDKMKVCEQAVNECRCLDIDYISREGRHTRRIIDPYVLILKQNIWYVYAYCHSRADWRTFKVGRIKQASFTGKTFERQPIRREDIPLNFGYTAEQLVPVTLEIKKEALADVEEWLGVDSIEPRGDGLVADVSLPDDETSVEKILGYGGKVRVLSPSSLRERVRAAAAAIAADNFQTDSTSQATES